MNLFPVLYAFEALPPGLEGDALRRFRLESGERRARLLDELEDVFTFLAENETLEGYAGMGDKHVEKNRDIQDAVESNCEGVSELIEIYFLQLLKRAFLRRG